MATTKGSSIMMTRRLLLASGTGLTAMLGLPWRIAVSGAAETFPITHSDAEWRTLLTPAQFAVLRQSSTERPFTSPLLKEHRPGVFACAGCNRGVFSSETKFESGTGWPSFWAPLKEDAVGTTQDNSLGMTRIAVHCAGCGGHLGHVFNDGPPVTGLRYCMNGVAMNFKPAAA
jgi:peptide-methionine (R)-S-oxide reductase